MTDAVNPLKCCLLFLLVCACFLVGCKSTVSRLELETVDLGDGKYSAFYINKDEALPSASAKLDNATPAFTWALLSDEFQLFPVNTLERYLEYDGFTLVRLFQNNPLKSQQIIRPDGSYILPDPVFQISSIQQSPSKREIAFSCRVTPDSPWTVWIMDCSGTKPRLLAFGKDPVWKNDATIVYSSKVDGRWSLVQSSVEGGNKRVLVGGPDDCLQPYLSPDGSKLAYVKRALITGQSQIWVCSLNGGDARKLTGYPGLDDSPVWSKDGKFVYFRSTRDGNWGAWRIVVD